MTKYIKDWGNEKKIYNKDKVITFLKSKEEFGGFSNMNTDFPLRVNYIPIPCSEGLYQACRFPDHPVIQVKVLNSRAESAKKLSKIYIDKTRDDWEKVRIKIMRWVLRVKLAQHFFKMGLLLEKTSNKDIVKLTNDDDFWGAIKNEEYPDMLVGVNALGRLLMELRDEYISENRYYLLVVEPPDIPNFKLVGVDVKRIDERENYIKFLKKKMNLLK